MMRRIVVALFAFVPATFSQEPSLLREARQALTEAIPQVAVEKLQRLMADAKLAKEERVKAGLLLGEALLETQRYDDALKTIAPLIPSAGVPARLLQADIFAAAGRWAKALPLYRELAGDANAPPAAVLGEAESLYALGEAARALDKLALFVRKMPKHIPAQLRLASLEVEQHQAKKARRTLAAVQPVEPDDLKWKKYVEARLLLLDDQPAPALVTFEEIFRDPEHLSPSLLVGVTFGITEAQIVLHGYDAADKVLEEFIGKYPDSPYLELVFQRLDQVYARQVDPSESELQSWAKSAPPRCAALARFYLARRQMLARKPEKAARTIEQFIVQYPGHSLLPYAHLLQADLLMEKRQMADAIVALEAAARHTTSDELRAEIELRTGVAHYHVGDFLLAGKFFDLAAERSPTLRETALYNSALSSLQQKNLDRFFEQYREMSAQFPASELRADLILEQGLVQARIGDMRSIETLELFLHNFPRHARTAEAQIALAELAFANQDIGGASGYLKVADKLPQSAATADHAAYLAVFLADAQTPRDEQAVIDLARQFIHEHAQSPLLPEVRMKLGQIFFRNNDFPNAETQLVSLARENPQSSLAEAALFLAGEAAMKTGAVQRALDLFDEVVKRDGALKLQAREQQALIETALGKAREAIALYDIILTAQPPPESELRHAALCGKADSYLALGAKDPAQIDIAIGLYGELAVSDAPLVWRNQALYKKAKALEQQSRTEDALSTYYDILNQSEPAAREYFWFYKAGFDAARIFEAQQQWRSAIGIYEKMAKMNGPRAPEAKELARHLRLERFIWE
jgi:outer membrane protein assembly factor BamD (BamD/ComL family)